MKIQFSISILITLTLLTITQVDAEELNFSSDLIRKFPVKGIDVSHHQNLIDWKKIKDQNISFVIIKSTEGKYYKDPKFKENWRNAQSNGLITGAYHFFNYCRSGSDQAINFIRTVPNTGQILPPAVDLKLGGNCKNKLSDKQKLKKLKTYLKEIEIAYQCPPVIYIMDEEFQSYYIKNLKRYPIWLQSYDTTPDFEKPNRYAFWQFSNTGILDGINGYVDLNIFAGSKQEFKQSLCGIKQKK